MCFFGMSLLSKLKKSKSTKSAKSKGGSKKKVVKKPVKKVKSPVKKRKEGVKKKVKKPVKKPVKKVKVASVKRKEVVKPKVVGPVIKTFEKIHSDDDFISPFSSYEELSVVCKNCGVTFTVFKIEGVKAEGVLCSSCTLGDLDSDTD